jgi:hypothetical protein
VNRVYVNVIYSMYHRLDDQIVSGCRPGLFERAGLTVDMVTVIEKVRRPVLVQIISQIERS